MFSSEGDLNPAPVRRTHSNTSHLFLLFSAPFGCSVGPAPRVQSCEAEREDGSGCVGRDEAGVSVRRPGDEDRAEEDDVEQLGLCSSRKRVKKTC